MFIYIYVLYIYIYILINIYTTYPVARPSTSHRPDCRPTEIYIHTKYI